MIRILQIMGGMNRRGAETFIMNVYRKIDRTKVQFDFLVYDNNKQDYEDEIIALGGRVIHMPCDFGLGAIKAVKDIRMVIEKYGPYKAIHAQTLLNIAFCWLAARKYPNVMRLAHSHNTCNRVTTNAMVRLYEKMALWIIRRYTQVMLACGEEAGCFLFGNRFKKEGIILNNGIDLDLFTMVDNDACDRLKRKFGLNNTKLIIGSVARFNEVKNHPFMLRIAEELKKNNIDFKMVFVGNGDGEKDIRNKVEIAGLTDYIVFAGLQSDINTFMHVFDVFLMPSIFEGNPVTLVEAQATGLPCVISDVITPKMDMGLQLITMCSLDQSASEWADAIIDMAKRRCCDVEQIKKHICEHGYDAKSTANKLLEIYLH